MMRLRIAKCERIGGRRLCRDRHRHWTCNACPPSERPEALMRIRMPSVLALIGVAEAMGCTNANVPVDWSCGEAAVPNGQRMECSTQSLTVQDTPYTCNSFGDYNPNCPPVGAGSDDGGTTDFNPISTGTDIDAGGGTSDGVLPGTSSSGSGSGAGANGSSGTGLG